MGQEDNILNVSFVKIKGKLIYIHGGDELLYKTFVDGLVEGQVVTGFFEANKDDGTYAQLSKIHVCIRKLAFEIGYSFEEMKFEIKRKAGLVQGKDAKSFANCSKEELALVITALNEAGEMVNISF